MSEQVEKQNVTGTYCLHCGDWIALPAASTATMSEPRGATVVPARDANLAYVVLWCSSCQKEAPYLRHDLIEQRDSSVEANPVAQSASVPWGHGMVLRRGHAA